MKTYDISVVIPCLNEELTIGKCVEIAFNAQGAENLDIEVIVADNGSTDKSVERAKHAGAKVVKVQQRGYGAALDSGIRAANSNIVVIADGDLSYDFNKLMDFYSILSSTDNDLVVGNRFRGGISKGAMPFLHRYLGNPVLSGIARILFSIPLGDFHCGIRGFKKSTYLKANPKTKGMEFATEMILRFVEVGSKIMEIPTTLEPDGRDRKPHLRSFPDGWRHLKLMLMYSPQFTLLMPGALFLLLGGIMEIELFINSQITLGKYKTDIQGAMLAILLAVTGAQLFSAGAIAIAYAKEKGISSFKWLPIKYSSIRAQMVLGIPLFLIGTGLIFLFRVFLDWKRNEYGHLNPVTEIRYSALGVTQILVGVILLTGAIQVRKIISKFW